MDEDNLKQDLLDDFELRTTTTERVMNELQRCREQTKRLADYLLLSWDDKITEGGAVDVAIKILEELRLDRKKCVKGEE